MSLKGQILITVRVLFKNINLMCNMVILNPLSFSRPSVRNIRPFSSFPDPNSKRRFFDVRNLMFFVFSCPFCPFKAKSIKINICPFLVLHCPFSVLYCPFSILFEEPVRKGFLDLGLKETK
jgi:hypothetical protein